LTKQGIRLLLRLVKARRKEKPRRNNIRMPESIQGKKKNTVNYVNK
jgi:hypothetical protein